MRVGTAYRYDSLTAYLGSTQTRVETAERKLNTGQRIEKPSDDAGGTRQLLSIGTVKASLGQYKKNLDLANSTLKSSEANYGDLGDMMQEVRALAIQGSTSTADQTTRDNLALQIETIQKRMLAVANEKGPDGRYLYGGQATDKAPFTANPDGTLTYNGAPTAASIEVGPGQSVNVSDAAGDVMTKAYANLTALKDSLKSGDVASLSNARLTEIEASSAAIIAARGDVGVRLQTVDAALTMNERRDSELTERASDIGEIDYAAAMVEYVAAQSAYEASLTIANKGFQLSLMDYLR